LCGWSHSGTLIGTKTFSSTPPAITVLNAKKIPPRGGDTLWCDLVDAYATLSAPIQTMLDGLIAVCLSVCLTCAHTDL
jgi:alpha-ketoglutarate-dependent taurine dioxygenase